MYTAQTTNNQTHQDVVGFDVSMENALPLHELEGKQQLLCVRPHCLDVETNVLPIPLQYLSQVHTGGEKESIAASY